MRKLTERLLALFLLIVLLPVLLAIALGIRLSSPGPIIFRQVRLGQGGMPFVTYKFRTMYDQPWKIEDFLGQGHDPRVTPFGRFLRKNYLDELPQLLNIVQGEMAFVGPRPQPPELAKKYASRCPRYRNRFKILPGITGFAQVRIEKGHYHNLFQSVAFDEYYRLRRCVRLDLEIIFKTISKMVRCTGH